MERIGICSAYNVKEKHMASDIVIRSVTYQGVPSVEIPYSDQQGVAVFVDTSDATLDDASHLPLGETAYADGVKITGSAAENDSSDLTASGATVTAPAGFYEQSASKSVASGSATAPATISGTGATVSAGSNTLTLSKTVSVTPSVDPGYVSNGTAANSSVSLTANVNTKSAATLQPGTSAVTIAAGTYLTGAQTIPAEPNYVASNVVAGKSLWGLNGTAQIPVISQDSTTKVLSIS